MSLQRKKVKRLKPVHTVSWLFLKIYHKPVQTGSDRSLDFSPRKCHNNVKTQSGSNRFTPIYGFCSKNEKEHKTRNRFKPVQADLRTLANENATTT
jgi:hypothetical protein